ncbi:hypothetical protein C8Q73DRAFT_788493 [Cubamyces lactineus]|nr:hypothetical protein C8Q73DRAFT_788493 [Cubamyces lactineus]
MWASGWGLIPTLILLWPLQGYAANFTFTYGAATQCDDFTVSWTGGSPPFQLTLAHVYGVPRTLDIPANSFSNGKGSFTTPLTIPAKDQFIAIMSDSTGFASGGASPLITAGKPSGKNTCSVTDPKLDFDYENNAALNQCRTYSFDNYVGAVQPVTIQGIVPGGTTFALYPPKGPTTFEWIADVAAGTQLVFIMTDSQGRQGGSSQVYTVGISDDATCLDKNSPATVAHPPSQSTSAGKPTASKTHTASATSTATSTAVPDGSGSSSKTSGGTIAAAIIGCLVGAFIVGTLVWFYMRRRRGTSVLKGGIFGKFQKKEVDLMHDPTIPPPAAVSPYPLYHPQAGSQVDVYTPNSTVNLLGNGSIGAGGRPSGDPFGTASAYAPSTTMFASQPPAPGSASIASGFPGGVPPPGHRDSIHDGSVHGGSVSSWDQSVTSAMRRKAANAGVSPYAPSTRFILHTDLEDDPPPPPDDEVIELPPQYSERRAPPPALDVGQPVAGPSGSRMEPSAPSASSSGYGSSSRYADTSELPPPPSPSIHSSSPGLAYLSDRNSFAPSEHSSVGTSRPS